MMRAGIAGKAWAFVLFVFFVDNLHPSDRAVAAATPFPCSPCFPWLGGPYPLIADNNGARIVAPAPQSLAQQRRLQLGEPALPGLDQRERGACMGDQPQRLRLAERVQLRPARARRRPLGVRNRARNLRAGSARLGPDSQ
jgi:hypothetical protein